MDYKTKYPDAKIIGVEMDRVNFELAKKNTNDLKDVEIVWGAIWYEDGKVSYRDDLNTDAYSAEVGSSEGGNLIEVNSYSIDSICAEYNLDVVDFLKMDIEGAEVEIFARPTKWLSKVKSFNIEFHRVDRERYIEVFTANGFICDKHPTHKNGIIGYRP